MILIKKKVIYILKKRGNLLKLFLSLNKKAVLKTLENFIIYFNNLIVLRRKGATQSI